MSQIEVPRRDRIRRVLTHLRDGTTDQFPDPITFEPGEYTDDGLAARERELIFGRVPIVIAHSTELPKPFDFVTLRLPRNQILVVRQRDGGLKAFLNLCRHRGALLEAEASGRCRLFSCGYHRWSYDPDGSLRSITRDTTFGDVDRSERGLVELPVEERHGMVWVVDNARGSIDVARWLGPEMDAILAGYELENLECFRAEGYDEPVNWKIMMDAFLDGYHIQYAHPNSAAKHVHTNVSAFEDFGRHCRFLVPRKSIDRWIEEDPGDADLTKHTIETHWIGPNSVLLRQPDNFQLLTFRPDPVETGRCRMEMRVFAPPFREGGSMTREQWTTRWEKNWQILLTVLHGEDFPLLRNAQTAVTSPDAGMMTLGKNEVANHVFHRERRRLLAASDEDVY